MAQHWKYFGCMDPKEREIEAERGEGQEHGVLGEDRHSRRQGCSVRQRQEKEEKGVLIWILAQ